MTDRRIGRMDEQDHLRGESVVTGAVSGAGAGAGAVAFGSVCAGQGISCLRHGMLRVAVLAAALAGLLSEGTMAQQVTFSSPAPLTVTEESGQEAAEPGDQEEGDEAGEDTGSESDETEADSTSRQIEVSEMNLIGYADKETVRVLIDGTLYDASASEIQELVPELDMASLPTIETPQDLNYGDTNDGVRTLQEELKEKGFLEGEADGGFGDMTVEAIKAFKESVGLPSDSGEADSVTVALLGDDSEPIEATYPPAAPTVEGKFPEIYKDAKKKGIDLAPYVDSAWKYSYDVFSSQGIIASSDVIGSVSVETPPIDRIAIETVPAIGIQDGKFSAGILIKATGASRPYISQGILADTQASAQLTKTLGAGGNATGEDSGSVLSGMSVSGTDGISEADLLDLGDAVDLIKSADSLTLRLSGTSQYDIDVDAEILKKFIEDADQAGMLKSAEDGAGEETEEEFEGEAW